jgi:hypothetical protein
MQSTTKLQKAAPKGAQRKFSAQKSFPKGMQSQTPPKYKAKNEKSTQKMPTKYKAKREKSTRKVPPK